jgi:hypothetical protein
MMGPAFFDRAASGGVSTAIALRYRLHVSGENNLHEIFMLLK